MEAVDSRHWVDIKNYYYFNATVTSTYSHKGNTEYLHAMLHQTHTHLDFKAPAK